MKKTCLLLLFFLFAFLPGCNFVVPQCSVKWLIKQINAANSTPATIDTITLASGCVYQLEIVNNYNNGNNGLPAITSPIIIVGQDATIMRQFENTDRFRLFYITAAGSLEISHVTLTGGYAFDPPHAILVGEFGGAILNLGTLDISFSLLQENYASEGGGIANLGDMTITSVTVESNHDTTTIPGGAGLNNFGDAIIKDTTFAHNGVPEIQDGVVNGGTMEMTNSTISHNGGYGIDNEGTLTLNHVTIAYNGLGAIASCGDVYISNSIIAQPPGTWGCGCVDVHPVFPNVDTTGTCGGIGVDIAVIHLGPLADNGGFTQTHALLPGSIAIDIVERQCLPNDQRGVPRPFGALCDAGAFEFNAFILPTTTPQPTQTLTPTLTPVTLPLVILTSTSTNVPSISCSDIKNQPDCENTTSCKWIMILTHPGASYCTNK